MTRPGLPTLASSLLLLTAACGGSRGRPATAADFRLAQTLEAVLERCAPSAANASTDGTTASADPGRCVAARERLCELAQETGDLDLRARCADARARVAEPPGA